METLVQSTPAATTPAPIVTTEAPSGATGAPEPSGATGATGTAAPAPAAAPKDESRAKIFAAIAQGERRARSIEARAKAEAARVEQERAALKADREAAESYRRELAEMRNDPLGFMQKHAGLDYETLTRRHVLGQRDAQEAPAKPAPDPRVEALEREAAEWRKERAAREKAAEDAKKQESAAAYRKAIEDEKAAKLAYAKEHSDDFEMVLADPDGATDVYLGLYAQAYQLAGRELEADEQIAVLKRTEELLTERESARLQRLSTTKRFGQRFVTPPKTAATEAPTGATKPPTPSGVEPKTLTNGLQGFPPPVGTTSSRAKTIDEIHAEAAARVAARFPANR